MMRFDGIDDEIMIPHLSTIITNQYTIEAWVRLAKVGPMNIICRSDDSTCTSTWSHQLRVNEEGKMEHYVEAGEKYCVTHPKPLELHKWYHVAGSAVADGELRVCQTRPFAQLALH